MVTVYLFAGIKELAGLDRVTVDVNHPVSVKEFMLKLSTTLPKLTDVIKGKGTLVAVNQEAAGEKRLIRDGDEVALMPPFAGGASQLTSRDAGLHLTPRTGLQAADFSVEAEVDRIKAVSSRIGGIAVFVGTARDFSRGRRVEKLVYEHYPGMAERKLAEIRLEARERFDIIEVTILHRTGEINAGGNIVLVVVGAEHRSDAFSACQWCIDTLKLTAPIWKKELTPEGEIWVEGPSGEEPGV